MNSLARTFASCIILLGVNACGAFSDAAAPTVDQQPTSVGGIELLGRNAESQMLFFITPDDVEKLCLAPPPDAIASFSESLSLGKVGESGSAGATSLGGRSSTVLLARELLYRACEFSQNYRLNKEEALSLYLTHLQTLERIAAALATDDGSSDDDDDDDDDDDGDDEDENDSEGGGNL